MKKILAVLFFVFLTISSVLASDPGSVLVIDTIDQKNNGTFPIVNAKDVGGDGATNVIPDNAISNTSVIQHLNDYALKNGTVLLGNLTLNNSILTPLGIDLELRPATGIVEVFDKYNNQFEVQRYGKFEAVLLYNATADTYTNISSTATTTRGSVTGDVLNVYQDFMYLGANFTSPSMYVDISSASSASNRTYEYSSTGGTWTNFTNLVDGSVNLTTDGNITWDMPNDWETATVNDTAGLYWIRVGTKSPDTFSTEPTLYVISPGLNMNLMEIFVTGGDTSPIFYMNSQGTLYALTSMSTGSLSLSSSISGATTGGFTGSIYSNLSYSQENITAGLLLTGVSGANATVPVHNSPILRFQGEALNTTSNTTASNAMDIYLNPGRGTPSSSRMVWKTTTIDEVANYSELMSLCDTGDLELFGRTTGINILNNSVMTGGTGWSRSGDWAYSTDDYTYTHSTGVGTVWQNTTTFLEPAKGNTWYKLVYAVDVVGTNSSNIYITNEFAESNTTLQFKTTGVNTVYFKTNANPGNFTIGTNSIAASAAQLDDVYLYQVLGGNITTKDVRLSNMSLGSSTYTSLNDFFKMFTSAGRLTGGNVTANGTNINISAGTGVIRIADDDVSQVKFFDWVANNSIATTANSTQYAIVTYNSGAPIATISNSENWDLDTSFPLAKIVNENGVVHVLNNPWWIGDGLTNVIERFQSLGIVTRDEHVGGLMLSVTGTRNVGVTAGTLWSRLNEFPITAFDSSVTGTFETYWYNGTSSSWTKANISQYPVLQYNNVSAATLQNMNNNFYGNYWVYVEADDNKIALVYPQHEYPTVGQAEVEVVPSLIPTHIKESGVLIGKILFKQNTDAPISVQSAFTTVFNPIEIADHGNLVGLGDDDHTQYALVTGARNLTALNVTNNASAANFIGNINWSYIQNIPANTTSNQATNTTSDVVFDNVNATYMLNLDPVNSSGGLNFPNRGRIYAENASNDGMWLLTGNQTRARMLLTPAYNWDTAMHFTYTPGTVGAVQGNLSIGQLQKNNATWTHGNTSFYTNGTEKMRIDQYGNVNLTNMSLSNNSVSINGLRILYIPDQANTSLNGTMVFGSGGNALSHTTSITGHMNTFVGAWAGNKTTTGNSNTALGGESLMNNTIGNNNIAIGRYSLINNINGSSNIAVGSDALKASTWGAENTAIGRIAMSQAVLASSNVAVGYSAMGGVRNGTDNVAVGKETLQSIIDGSYNTVVGEQAMYGSVNTTLATAIGYGAGYNGTIPTADITGSTFLGAYSKYNTDALYSTAIGYNATLNKSNQIVLGASNLSETLINGEVVVPKNVTALFFNGNGSLLVGLNATSISDGTLNIARLPVNSTFDQNLNTTSNVKFGNITTTNNTFVIDVARGKIGTGLLPSEISTVDGLTSSRFEMVTNDLNNDSDVVVRGYGNISAAGPFFMSAKARGNSTSPLILADQDNIGGFMWLGYNGTKFRQVADILVKVDGAPSGTTVPTAFFIEIMPTGAGIPYPVLFARPSQRVAIGKNNGVYFEPIAYMSAMYQGPDTSNVTDMVGADVNSNGTVADGFGAGWVTFLETNANTKNLASRISTFWSTAANATRTSTITINGINSAVTEEWLRLTGSGINTTKNITAPYFVGAGALLTGINTSIVTEGTNLYYTTARTRGDVNATLPLSLATGTFSISQANATTNGYLDSANWTAFNNKVTESTTGTNTSTINITKTTYALSADLNATLKTNYDTAFNNFLNKTLANTTNDQNLNTTSDVIFNNITSTNIFANGICNITGSVNATGGVNVRTVANVTSATPAINVSVTDIYTITGLDTNITNMTSGLTGTAINGQKLTIRILDNGTAQNITWGPSFKTIAPLPTTTVASKYLYVGLTYCSADNTWHCTSTLQE